MELRPFWSYFGGKWRIALKYPYPKFDTIIEPFAGAAGYSLRYSDRNVILVEKYPVVAGIWRYLIAVSAAEILRIPAVTSVDDLPTWVPQEARYLIGFWMNHAVTSPRCTASRRAGWTVKARDRIASQVDHIRHWKIIEGDYTRSPDDKASWFIDPPYIKEGFQYKARVLDYYTLASWCKTRKGQILVCEHLGAQWLPFYFLASQREMRTVSQEVLWTNEKQKTEILADLPRLSAASPTDDPTECKQKATC